jgi:opacity protein-like surface antigen
MQDWLIGPRVFFPPRQVDKYKINPFAEFKLGSAHLSERIQQTLVPSQSASDNAFAWALGGGADYQFASQWFARVNLDLLRTHFADSGQSRLRFVLGIGYNFSPRSSTR